jgi:hypothetical protein
MAEHAREPTHAAEEVVRQDRRVAGWLVGAESPTAGGVLDLIRTLAIFGVPFMTSAYLIRRAHVHG